MSPHTEVSGGDSEGRPLPGPRPPPPAWKGMGSPRRLCRTIDPLHTSATRLTQPCSTLHLLLLFAGTTLAWASASGFSLQGSGHCQIDQCFEQYNSAKDALQLSAAGAGDVPPMGGPGGLGAEEGGEGLNREAMCVALRTYWSCIQGTKNSSRGCQGDIRYYSIRNGVKQQMQHYNCTLHGPTVDPASPSPRPRPVPPQCRYLGRKVFRHCGLFGDPHLRTFTKQFQTCKVKGAWPLVNNQHLTVQVTNDPVLGAAGDATATSKLTVIVKSRPECGWEHYHTYQAQTDELPSAFEDGHTSYGHYNSVQLMEVEPNRHVEIHVHHIATTLIVRQIGRYFTFAIHMPEELVHEGEVSPEPELCSKGCPPGELIDYKRYLAHKKDRVTRVQGTQGAMSRDEAVDMCKRAGLVDFYFDSCVFDLLATGDTNFTVAALSALQDVVRLDPAMAHVANRTSLHIYDDLFGAAPPATRTSALMCVLSLVLTLCLMGWWPVR